MAKIELELNRVFVSIPCNLSYCKLCDDMIFGKMYKVGYRYLDRLVFSNVVICESCYGIILK